MNNKIRERLGAEVFKYNGIYVSVDKITQKSAVHLFEYQFGALAQTLGRTAIPFNTKNSPSCEKSWSRFV